MQLRVIAVGKVRERYLDAALADFRERLRPYHRLEEIELRSADGSDPARAMRSEGEAILAQLAPDDVVWLLDPRGELFDSPELARRITQFPHDGVARLTLVIAGTYGAADAVIARANLRWSLSPLTFLHGWARVLVLEQLYRAAKIARDEPYHH
jgi:23S rRNA (pseudouridine1915-N3)-methyltransferase